MRDRQPFGCHPLGSARLHSCFALLCWTPHSDAEQSKAVLPYARHYSEAEQCCAKQSIKAKIRVRGRIKVGSYAWVKLSESRSWGPDGSTAAVLAATIARNCRRRTATGAGATSVRSALPYAEQRSSCSAASFCYYLGYQTKRYFPKKWWDCRARSRAALRSYAGTTAAKLYFVQQITFNGCCARQGRQSQALLVNIVKLTITLSAQHTS